MEKQLESVQIENTPFTHYKAEQRAMEEVFILQILFEQIKQKDLNLLRLSDHNDDQEEEEEEEEDNKDFTTSLSEFIEAAKRIFVSRPVSKLIYQ